VVETEDWLSLFTDVRKWLLMLRRGYSMAPKAVIKDHHIDNNDPYLPTLKKKKKVKECAGYLWKSISQLRSVTCRMGSRSVTCHPTQANTPRLYTSPTGWYSIYRPFKDGWLSKPRPRVQRATGPRLLRDSPGQQDPNTRPSER